MKKELFFANQREKQIMQLLGVKRDMMKFK